MLKIELNHEEYQFFIRANTLTIDRETQFPNPFPIWLNETSMGSNE